MPIVYKLRDLKTGTPFLVLPGVVTVGRHEDAHIKLADESVSRRHAQIHNTDAGVYVVDAGSSNGTFVESVRVSQATPLELGMEVRFGNVKLRLDPEVSGPSGAEEPVPQPQISWESLQRRTDRIPRDPGGVKTKTSLTRKEATESGRLVTVQSASFPGGAMFPKVLSQSPVAPAPEPPAPVAPRSAPAGPTMRAGAIPLSTVVSTVPYYLWVVVFLAGLGLGVLLGLVLAYIFFVR